MTAVPVTVSAAGPRTFSRRALVVAVLVAWVALWALLKGRDTLALDGADQTPVHIWLNGVRDWVDANRNSSPIFVYGVNEIRQVLDGVANGLRALLAIPALNLPIPVLGWLGVVALLGYLAWLVGNLRVGLLTVAGLLVVGMQGLWQPAMDTLAMTLSAVLVSLAVGIPLGVWAALDNRFHAVATPVLDFMQTMPSFVYLAPMTLLFAIGPASAVIVTLIYALPPVMRLTDYGIREVAHTTVEAAESLGATRWQLLRQVLLPMARKTIVVGVNQTIMAALSMVTIAALIDSPGLGKVVVKALESADVGTAFNAGLALVILAVMLDRTTTAAADRSGRMVPPTAAQRRRRRVLEVALGVLALVLAYLSHTYLWAATFAESWFGQQSWLNLGKVFSDAADTSTTWVQDTFPVLTGNFKDVVTAYVLEPVQQLLADSPWYVTSVAILALALIVGGRWAAVVAAGCLALLMETGLWQDAMVTLASTLLATVVVILLGVVVGVAMGRSRRVDAGLRPLLDAAQVLPAFVYLVPFLALFEASRFTAIAAAVVYAAPVSVKIIADGIRAVSPPTVEAATAAGSSTWQLIRKVQLPMSASALTLAANQGLIYVLSMVVVGGLVGGGALGFDVVEGFTKAELKFGKGLAAGFAIVLLGIMLDRITQAAARRLGRPGH